LGEGSRPPACSEPSAGPAKKRNSSCRSAQADRARYANPADVQDAVKRSLFRVPLCEARARRRDGNSSNMQYYTQVNLRIIGFLTRTPPTNLARVRVEPRLTPACQGSGMKLLRAWTRGVSLSPLEAMAVAPPLRWPMLVWGSCGSMRSPLNVEPRPARSNPTTTTSPATSDGWCNVGLGGKPKPS
jgi:hypothetical protein